MWVNTGNPTVNPSPASAPDGGGTVRVVVDPQRANPGGIRARATDHAVRRYAERALGIAVDGEDAAALATLRARGVNVGAIRRRISIQGGLGVANGAHSVIADGLRLVIADGAVVTVLARKIRPDFEAAGEVSPVPPRRPRSVLDRDYADHD